MTAINHADAIRIAGKAATRVYAGSVLVWQQFKPTDLVGCVVWMDASTISAANGAPLSSWTNLGSGSNPTILGTPNPVFRTNALNTSMPCVRITQGQGRYRWTGLNLDREYTLFIVARRWQLRGGRILTALGTTANALWGWHGNEFECAYQEGWFNTPGPTGGITSTAQWRMYSADGSAANTSRLFGFGSLLGQHPTPPASKGFGGTLNISGYTNDVDVAVSQQADCEIAELIVYNRKMPDAERQKVEQHLMRKWNPISVFKPTDLGNLVGWFDGSDATKVTLVGGRVSAWINKGQGWMDFTQPTAAYRPTYANNAVNMVSPQALNVFTGPPGSMPSFDAIWVSTPNSSSNGEWRTLFRSNAGPHQVIIEAGSTRLGTYNGGFWPAGTLTWPQVKGIGFARMNGGAVAMLSRDGGPVTTTGTTLPVDGGEFSIFGAYMGPPPSQGWGEINEIVFLPYNAEGSRQMVEGYLAHRHGLAGLLPAGHPYKTSAP